MDRRIARHEPRREIPPPNGEPHGGAERESQQEQGAEPCLPDAAFDRVLRDDAQNSEVTWKAARHRRPEIGAQKAVGPLEQRAREKGPPAVAHLGGELLGLDQDGPGQALRLIEFGDGALPLGAVIGEVGALLGVVLLGLGAELVKPRLGGLKLWARSPMRARKLSVMGSIP